MGVTVLACKYETCILVYLLLNLHFIAVINIGIGISLLESSDYKILWLYVAFVIILALAQVVLFITYTVNAYKAPQSGELANNQHTIFITEIYQIVMLWCTVS